MKLDFLGRYKDVARLLEAPAKPVEQQQAPAEFSTLLGDISPFAKKEPEIIKETQAPKTVEIPEFNAEPEDYGPLARFDFPVPELTLPGFEKMEVAPTLPDIVKEGEVTVKTPEGVEASRIRVGGNLHEMPEAERLSQVRRLIDMAGTEHGVDPMLGLAVAKQESSFNPMAVSRDGHESKGLFQLLDSTGSELFTESKAAGEYNPFNPEQNVELGIKYLRKLHDIFSKPTELPNNLSTSPAANSSSLEKLAVAAFNAGEGRVASAQDRAQRAGMNPSDYDSVSIYLPESTQEYVQKVIGYKLEFESELPRES